MAENESAVKNGSDPERRAIALAWLFHLVGDIHQPLHTAQLITVDYPQGDRGGNEICVRVTQAGQPMDLHRFWDGVITSSQNLTRLRNEATALRNRQEFQRRQNRWLELFPMYRLPRSYLVGGGGAVAARPPDINHCPPCFT